MHSLHEQRGFGDMACTLDPWYLDFGFFNSLAMRFQYARFCRRWNCLSPTIQSDGAMMCLRCCDPISFPSLKTTSFISPRSIDAQDVVTYLSVSISSSIGHLRTSATFIRTPALAPYVPLTSQFSNVRGGTPLHSLSSRRDISAFALAFRSFLVIHYSSYFDGASKTPLMYSPTRPFLNVSSVVESRMQSSLGTFFTSYIFTSSETIPPTL